MLVSRNYRPAVGKCGFALVPSIAMKEAGASASSCAFIWGEELPITPAVPHKGRGAKQGLSSRSLPPSFSWAKPLNKSWGFLSASLQSPGPRRRCWALLFYLFPAPQSLSELCTTWAVLPPQSVTKKNCTGSFASKIQDFSSFVLCFLVSVIMVNTSYF